jgi:amidase
MTGQPAISLPLATSSTGLPIGVQLAGRFGEDARLLALAAQLEAAQPWLRRLPAVVAG